MAPICRLPTLPEQRFSSSPDIYFSERVEIATTINTTDCRMSFLDTPQNAGCSLFSIAGRMKRRAKPGNGAVQKP